MNKNYIKANYCESEYQRFDRFEGFKLIVVGFYINDRGYMYSDARRDLIFHLVVFFVIKPVNFALSHMVDDCAFYMHLQNTKKYSQAIK